MRRESDKGQEATEKIYTQGEEQTSGDSWETQQKQIRYNERQGVSKTYERHTRTGIREHCNMTDQRDKDETQKERNMGTGKRDKTQRYE